MSALGVARLLLLERHIKQPLRLTTVYVALSKTAISHVLTPLRSFSHPSLPRARYPPHEPAQPLVVHQSAPGLPERPRPRISL